MSLRGLRRWALLAPLIVLAVALLSVVLSPRPLPPAVSQPTASEPTAPAATLTEAPPEATLTPLPSPTATATAAPTFTPTLTPTTTPEPPVRFAVIGDYGLAGQPEADVAALVLGWNPDFIITTGDNNYPSGSASSIDDNIGQYYHAYLYPYVGAYGSGADRTRFFPSLGNHDWLTSLAAPYQYYFELPGNERYYDFTWGPLHFFVLDSDSHEPDGVGRSSIQAQWLQNAMAASTSPWQIVYFHHAPYSSGLHGPVDWMQWPFKEWGAEAVLSGHDHTYERLEIDGLVYFVNGVGGGPIYYFTTVYPGSQLRYNAGHGAMLVEATAQQVIFQFITVMGEVIDSYMIK